MIDGSSHDSEENVRMTKAVVDASRKKDISVEAEIGHVGTAKRYPSISLPKKFTLAVKIYHCCPVSK